MQTSSASDEKKKEEKTRTKSEKSEKDKKSRSNSKEEKSKKNNNSKEGSKKSVKSTKEIKTPDEDKFDKLVKESEKEKKKEKSKSDKSKSAKKSPAGGRSNDEKSNEKKDTTASKNTMSKGTISKDTASKDCTKEAGQPPTMSQSAQPQEVPGENFQIHAEKGGYLLELPIFSMILCILEFVLYIAVFVIMILASDGHVPSVGMFIINSILLTVLVAITLMLQWRRLHVQQDTDLNGHLDFKVKPLYRRIYALSHFARLWICLATVIILVYFLACGDEKTGVNKIGFCSQSIGYVILALAACIVAIVLVIVHIYFFFRNRMAISNCGT
ncbi:unnamed protein product [Bursaphelenchus okinawaensis]|uniref:Uncharacterized protein n=1 Tax=Bursaphelenchus okinawaensis TaxID=465554 RepID=A0A811L8P3_9BILA|nr:unnamed protein product [Bursaphelenchus okinawaensis]CAG9119582.1 unnamed protein product [Bursaphelenchus okinawaensis]